MSKDSEQKAIIRHNDEGDTVKNSSTSDWLFGDSEMARRIRALDWSATPLGPREHWPAPLRMTVNLVLSSKLPMLILWGQNLIALHNDASLEIFDQEQKAVLGRPMPEVWPEQWPKSEARIMAVMARGESFHQNVSFPSRNQARPYLAHFAVTDTPIYLENGSVGGVLAIFQETTQAVEHLRALERTQATLQAAVASSPDAMVIADADGNVVTINEAFAKFHRFSNEEASRRTPADYAATFDILLPDGSLVPRADWAIPRALQGETGVNVERTIRRKDTGESWTCSLCFAPTRNAQGEIMGAILSARDTTEQKRAERALRESELKYATIFEKSPYALILVSAPSGTCCAVNDAFLRLFEFSRDEILGKTAAELNLTNDQSQQEVYALLVEKGSVRAFECVRYTKHGRKLNVAMSLDWVRIEGALYVLTTVEDISARLEAAESKRLYLESQTLGKLKSRFLANISHEFRTPLALILGPTELLLASPDTPEAVRRHLSTTLRNARTLLGYINNLLDLAKVETGQLTLAYAAIDVASLVRVAASHFQGLIVDTDYDFKLEMPPRLIAEIDPEMVQRIVLNLLANAFKFTPSKGRVRLTLKEVEDRVRIEVADSGPGIPISSRERIFDRFGSSNPGATGLGLAIVREFVAAHRGTISIDQAPDGGALFIVDLPAKAPAGSIVAPERTDTPRQAKALLDGTARLGD